MSTASNLSPRKTRDEAQPDAAATAAIQEAIKKANYANKGVVFGPFHMKIVPGAYNKIWSTADGFTFRPPMTFFKSTVTGNFLPLGDAAIQGYGSHPFTAPPPPASMMLFAPSPNDPKSLAHPTDFRAVLDDGGSGNENDLQYWWPIAPAGYSAVGICFSNGKPNTNNYWCVKNSYLQSIGTYQYWSDSGQGWHANGNLYAPVFVKDGASPTNDGIFIVPQTLLSAQDIGNEPAFALVGQQADLPIARFDPPVPAYDPNIVSGDYTTYGLTSVKVVPYSAVPADAHYPNQGLASPFYFIACEPYWLCTNSIPTPDGGKQVVSVTVGTSESESKGFKETTTLSVSAEFGAMYGALEGKVSATFTQSFELSREETKGMDTSVTKDIEINFPKQPVTWIWARQTQIAVFRNDLTELAPVSYGNEDQRFVPAGATIVGEKK